MLMIPNLCLAVYFTLLCVPTCDKLSLYRVVAPANQHVCILLIFAFCMFFMIFFKEWVLEERLRLSMLQHQAHQHKLEIMPGMVPVLLLPAISEKMS